MSSLIYQTTIWAQNTIQPGFDCKKAKTAVEKNICSNPKLAELDQQVSAAFFDLKKNPTGRIRVSVPELLKDQETWLKYRNEKDCLDECLIKKYEDRLAELTFPGAPKILDDAKIKALDSYFTNKSCDSLGPIAGSLILETDGLEKWSCKIFASNLSRAEELFYGCDDNRNKGFFSCDYSEAIKKIDGLKEYIEYLVFLRGNATLTSDCLGGLEKYEVAGRDLAILHTLYDIDAAKTIAHSESLNFNSFGKDPFAALKHFSLQGIWEKNQYNKFLSLKEKTQHGLEEYYVASKKMSIVDAKRLANAHLMELTNEYISSHYSRYNDWNLDKVDTFLKSGTLPSNDNFEYSEVLHSDETKTVEQAKPEILAYFLKLAIVNNYPKDAIEKIINAGANLQNPKVSDNALMNSVKRPDIMKLLLDKGANVNAQNAFGKTVLMYAIQYGDLETVKLLISHKANINLATFEKAEDPCTYSLGAGNRTPLMYAAWHANNEVVDYLLAKGADPNAKDTNGHDYKFYLSQNDYQKNI